ncbi:MAG TPA: citrate synthase/methylcitrate synthase, partial [Acidobacteria bacterium]|nr:citrate synthase/methylcitrate synthase [Acidobacteriota bacterium]
PRQVPCIAWAASSSRFWPMRSASLRAAAARRVDPMDALRMAAGTLSLAPEAGSDPRADAALLVAAFPTIVAAYHRLLQGDEPLTPRADLSHAASFLYLLTGQEPDAERVRGLETYLNTV